MTKPGIHELRLSVSYFYGNDDTRNLITSEESTLSNCSDDDEYFSWSEKFIQCYICHRSCRISRSTLLTVLLFCTLAAGVLMVAIVLLCTFMSMSTDEKDQFNEQLFGIINWLHYPVGDLTIRRANETELTITNLRFTPRIPHE